jgi:23S rRNA (cytidine2498-2'-O)-methyltransferase
MDMLHQIMLLCRPGFENECAAEIMDHAGKTGFAAYVKAGTGTGYAILVSAEGRDTTGLMQSSNFNELIFARQWFACTQRIDGLPDNDRTPPLITAAAGMAAQLGMRFNDLELSYPDTNEGKALSRFCRSFRPHLLDALERQNLLSPESSFRLHLFFLDSARAWPGISSLNNSAPNPMGIPRLRMPESAPSRSTLKLEEAINWFFDKPEQDAWFRPGMRAVDLGAAPGGWSWQLVKRGLLVTAVDNGPMNAGLMKTGMVEHVRADAFKYIPEHRIDWLVCDMVERPLHVSRLITRWFVRYNCKAAIFNLKLPMKKRYQSVLECKGVIEQALNAAGIGHSLRIKHLYHDREEVTACITAAGDAGRA